MVNNNINKYTSERVRLFFPKGPDSLKSVVFSLDPILIMSNFSPFDLALFGSPKI